LSFVEAAAIPVVGVTAFRALFFHGKLSSDMTVLVTGIGSGVAQFASLSGGSVYVTSRSNHKIHLAKQKLGVTGGVNTKNTEWDGAVLRMNGKPFDLIIDGVGGSQFNILLKILKPG
jgi:zinc-binding alcohol dehydrogenase/oxidoreductase